MCSLFGPEICKHHIWTQPDTTYTVDVDLQSRLARLVRTRERNKRTRSPTSTTITPSVRTPHIESAKVTHPVTLTCAHEI